METKYVGKGRFVVVCVVHGQDLVVAIIEERMHQPSKDLQDALVLVGLAIGTRTPGSYRDDENCNVYIHGLPLGTLLCVPLCTVQTTPCEKSTASQSCCAVSDKDYRTSPQPSCLQASAERLFSTKVHQPPCLKWLRPSTQQVHVLSCSRSILHGQLAA